jgi:hypothetical protein
MKHPDEFPDEIRELIMTDATVRFLYDDCERAGAGTNGTFYRMLALYLAQRLKDLQ